MEGVSGAVWVVILPPLWEAPAPGEPVNGATEWVGAVPLWLPIAVEVRPGAEAMWLPPKLLALLCPARFPAAGLA